MDKNVESSLSESVKSSLLSKIGQLVSCEKFVDLYRIRHGCFCNVNNPKSVDCDFDVRVSVWIRSCMPQYNLSLECKIPIIGRKDVKGIDDELRRSFDNWGSDSLLVWCFGINFDDNDMCRKIEEINEQLCCFSNKQDPMKAGVKKMPSGFYHDLNALRLQCFKLSKPEYAQRLLDIMLTHTK